MYNGPENKFHNFIMALYNTHLPLLHLMRREGNDVECFYPKEQELGIQAPRYIQCEYFVPIAI